MSRITHDICNWLHVPHHEHAQSFEHDRHHHKMIIAGGKGYLGKLLIEHFGARGWNIVVLSRRPHHSAETNVRFVGWDGRTVDQWSTELEGADALINLAGRSVNCRYHARNRREMMDSRVKSTRALGGAIGRCVNPPKVWLNSSTATIYEHTYGPAWDEKGRTGWHNDAHDRFSVEIARAWEHAVDEFSLGNVRVVKLRSAMVLGHDSDPNNAFVPLRRLARIGLGGRMGAGRQFVSWIHESDFCRAIEYIIENDSLADVVNIAAPQPLTNAEMMLELRKTVGTPVGIPASNWMLELGAFFLRTETELIIKSRRVVPGKLLNAGFEFGFPAFQEAISDLLSPTKPTHPITRGGNDERSNERRRIVGRAHAT